MTNLETTVRADVPDAEFMDTVVFRLTAWQAADRDPDYVHAENSRLAVWTRSDGCVYLTAATGSAVVAVDCTGADLRDYAPVHPHVAAVLEGETHAPEEVDLLAFWDWLGDATVNGKCLACDHRCGKIFGTPFHLGVIKGALGSVYDFLDRDAEADWKRLVQAPPGGRDVFRAARLESEGQWIIVCLSRNVKNPLERFAPEWPRDYEITADA